MTRVGKAAVVLGVAVAAGLVLAAKAVSTPDGGGQVPRAAPEVRQLPRLVDLGAKRCIPCKAMAPILDQLRADYAGRLEVTFIDVWRAPDEAAAYRLRVIPTQIFYGTDGRELARHQGFMSREEIVAQWKALGVEL